MAAKVHAMVEGPAGTPWPAALGPGTIARAAGGSHYLGLSHVAGLLRVPRMR